MTDRERRIRQRLRDDLQHYSARCLKIVPKEGGMQIPLVLNTTQLAVHKALEGQRARIGMVRAIVLKARKQGVSTYISARFFHRITNAKALRARVMTHHSDTTKEVFEMIRRFQEHLPALVRPHAMRNSVHELAFDRLDSFYGVATAGAKEVGRGGTPQLLHCSEFQIWPNADSHMAGIVASVPDKLGTEIVFEGTGNGMGNTFHRVWEGAVKGENRYMPVFIPWYMDPTYRLDAPDFYPTDEEREIAVLHNLDNEQLAWRRDKIAELKPWRFMQEYPATPAEAFTSGTEDPLIDGNRVLAARKRTAEAYGEVWVGIDPARQGKDRTALVARQGPKQLMQRTFKIPDLMQLVGALRPVLDSLDPFQILVDIGGLGAGVHDRLLELGYPVVQINFGATAQDRKRFANLKAEMWHTMAEWLEEADILDSDELHADLVGQGYGHDSNGRLVLESKDSMKVRGVSSPDLGDALAMAVIGPTLASIGQFRSWAI